MSKAYKKTKYVKRYCVPDQLMHWTIALGFVLLMVTGFIIFFKGPASLLTTEAGIAIRVIHRIGAIMFIGAPIIYLIFSSKRLGFLVAFKWNKGDLGWLKAAPKHYSVGGKGMPPQGKYNTGQKLFFLVAIVFGLLLVISGFVLWFDRGSETAGMWALLIHDIAALIITIFFGVHLHLTVFHARERESFNAMTTGWMDAEYAEHHHKKWFDEVKYNQMITCGKRKREKYMQSQAESNNSTSIGQ